MGDRKQKTGDKRHRWEMRHSEGSTTGDPQPLKCKECQEKVVKKNPYVVLHVIFCFPVIDWRDEGLEA